MQFTSLALYLTSFCYQERKARRLRDAPIFCSFLDRFGTEFVFSAAFMFDVRNGDSVPNPSSCYTLKDSDVEVDPQVSEFSLDNVIRTVLHKDTSANSWPQRCG